MASYHLRNGVGEPIKCAHDPCRLHGGSDFQASNMKQASEIAAQIVANMYNNVDVQGMGADGDKKMKKVVSSLHSGRIFYRKDDDSIIGKRVNGIMQETIKANPDIRKADGSMAHVVNGYFTDAVMQSTSSLDDATAQSLVDDYPGKFTTLQAKARNSYSIDGEPTTRQLAGAAMIARIDDRMNDMLSDSSMVDDKAARRIKVNAGRILNGGIDLDANYVATQEKQLAAAQAKIPAANDEERKELMTQIAACRKNLKRGTVPYLVKKRMIQNAWRNASPAARRKAIASMDPDVIRHVPPESLARSLRHRSQDQRFEILDRLGSKDKPAMENAIFIGAVRQSDAMAWSNKHPVKGAPDDEVETRRTINAFLRAKYVKQGNARYTPKQAARISARMKDTSRFVDENGQYNPRKHAQALFNLAYGTGAKSKDGKTDRGYLPVATTIISNRALPDKAMVEFAALCDKREESVLAHSKYQSHYASKHVNKETGQPTYMKRWHALKTVIPHLYGDVFKEARALNANRAAQE